MTTCVSHPNVPQILTSQGDFPLLKPYSPSPGSHTRYVVSFDSMAHFHYSLHIGAHLSTPRVARLDEKCLEIVGVDESNATPAPTLEICHWSYLVN